MDVFIAHPGDSIHLDVDFKDIGNVKFSGDAQKINTDLYAYLNSNYVVVDDDTIRRTSVGDLQGFIF